jgi:hypothetical protein
MGWKKKKGAAQATFLTERTGEITLWNGRTSESQSVMKTFDEADIFYYQLVALAHCHEALKMM